MKTLLQNCDILADTDAQPRFLRQAYLGIDGAYIRYIGGQPPAEHYDRTISLSHRLLLPGLVNCHGHVSVSDQLCEGLMRAIVQAGTTVISRPEDYNARAELMWAGTLAHNDLCGVGREQDWASHMIEHALSAQSNCAHGAGLAVVLPA